MNGSLPSSVLQRVQTLERQKPGKAFVYADRELDKASFGPVWLKNNDVAYCVLDSLRKGEELQHYVLHAFVVMANHVHALVDPKIALARLMNALKGVTARKANQILGRTGQPFWQDESFDHWVRNGSEFERIWRYIESNPVKAGLVAKAEHWRWSSASLK